MTSTDTQGISACDQAFEEKYKTSSRDPSNEGDLAIWRDAWAAKGADALAAIKAARVQALEEAAKLVQDYDTYGDPTQGWQDIFAERIRLLVEDAGRGES